MTLESQLESIKKDAGKLLFTVLVHEENLKDSLYSVAYVDVAGKVFKVTAWKIEYVCSRCEFEKIF